MRGTTSRPTCAIPPYFDGMGKIPGGLSNIQGARPLGQFRRFDHDRPHLARRLDQERTARPGKYLLEHGVQPMEFNQ